MLSFKNLFHIDKKSSISIYRQLATQFILLIKKGILLPDTVLPSTRSLALDLSLHRKTVMAAYNDLIAENWIESQLRKRYKVSKRLPIIKPRSYNNDDNGFAGYGGKANFLFDQVHMLPKTTTSSKLIVNDGFPDTDISPIDKILKEYRKLLNYNSLRKSASEWDIGGTQEFKESLHLFLNETRGLNLTPENLLITKGAQMAIYLSAALLIKSGDKVVVSDPSYFMADSIFKQLGAVLIRVPVDEEGMDVGAIEDILKNNTVKLLYIIPHHHYPTTVTLSEARRVALLKIIRAYQLPVIEDDYDHDFQYHYNPYLPLASGDHAGNVIYIGSLTKVLGPPFRLGYMIATADCLQNALKLKSLVDLRSDVLTEGAVASFINSGTLSRYIKASNKLYGYRCCYMTNLINKELRHAIDFTGPQGGMALWLKFKESYPLSKIITKASSRGLQLVGSSYYKGADVRHNALRFGFASLNETDMEYAVDILKKITTP